jgi:hypothetical protein
MENVERMYRHLVRTIRTSFPQYLAQPFEVGELYQTILPYRLHRRELGLETNEDYEHTLLELLKGANGYLQVDDRMRDALNADGDPQRIRQFAAAHASLSPQALAQLENDTTRVSGSTTAPRASAVSASTATLPAPSDSTRVMPPADSARRVVKPVTIREEGESCPYCKGALPGGRQIAFCPHCGQDLTTVRCPACGSELERGWKFCVTCGRGVT